MEHLPDDGTVQVDVVKRRCSSLLEIFELINLVYESAFKTDDQLKEAVAFLYENAKPFKQSRPSHTSGKSQSG